MEAPGGATQTPSVMTMEDSILNSVIRSLDIKTLIFIVGVQCACQAAIFIYLWRLESTYAPAKDWAYGSFLRAAGLLFISTRDFLPLWPSVIFGNSFLVAGDLFFNFGIVEAAERKAPWRAGAALAGLTALSIYVFHFEIPDLAVRVALVGFAEVIYESIAIYACLQYAGKFSRLTFRLIALILTLHCASSIWRIVYTYVNDVQTIFLQSPEQILYAACLIVFVFLITALLVLLTAQRYQKELHDQSRQDFLTNAFNRRAFESIAAGEWSRTVRHGHPASFLMLDIDHFKTVNDRYGHGAGDKVLVEVSGIARTMLRREDVWCRYGGEEFAVLLPETGGRDRRAPAPRHRGRQRRNAPWPDPGDGQHRRCGTHVSADALERRARGSRSGALRGQIIRPQPRCLYAVGSFERRAQNAAFPKFPPLRARGA